MGALGKQQLGAAERKERLPPAREPAQLNCFPQFWAVVIFASYSHYYNFSHRVGTECLLSGFLTGVGFSSSFTTCTDLPQHERLGPVSSSEETALQVLLWRHLGK